MAAAQAQSDIVVAGKACGFLQQGDEAAYRQASFRVGDAPRVHSGGGADPVQTGAAARQQGFEPGQGGAAHGGLA